MASPEFAERIRAAEAVVGAWSSIGHPVVAEVLAATAADFVVVDGEHSENSIESIANSIRAVEATAGNTVPVVRASGVDRDEIKRLLDLGPNGIVIPQIESVADAREAISAAEYPPSGVRGVAGGRASGYGTNLEEYVNTAERQVATILQVETEGALDSIDEIVEIDGLDALFIGPADLSARLGRFGEFGSDRFREAVERIVETAENADIPVGTIATDPEAIEEQWNWGMDYMVLGTDIGSLRIGANRFRERFDNIRD